MNSAPSLVARAAFLLLIGGAAGLVARQVVVARRNPSAYWTPARTVAWGLVALLVLYVRGPLFVQTLMPPEQVLVDFFQEWSSVQNWKHGFPIYEDQDRPAARYLGHRINLREHHAVEVNAHPPAAVLMTLPVALLPYSQAVLVWNLLSLVLGAAALWTINSELRLARSWRPLLALVPLALLFSPFLLQTFFAQLNLLLLFLIVGAWAAARRGQDVLGGIFLGTAVVVKLFPGFLCLYFALQGRWRLVAGATITVLAWTGATMAIFGIDAHAEYAFKVLPRVHEWRGAWGNLSVLGWWSRLFDPGTKGGAVVPIVHAPLVARVGTYACSALLVMAASWICWRARNAQQELGLGLTIVTMLLVSPTCWDHYLSLLLLPAAQLWSTLNDGRLLGMSLTILLPVWLPTRALFVLGGVGMPPLKPAHSLLLFSLRTYALLAFWLFLAFGAMGKYKSTAATT